MEKERNKIILQCKFIKDMSYNVISNFRYVKNIRKYHIYKKKITRKSCNFNIRNFTFLNLCSRAVNSQWLLCCQKAGMKC